MTEPSPSTSSSSEFKAAKNLTDNSSMDNVSMELDKMDVNSSSSSNEGDSTCKSPKYKYTESCKKKLDEVLNYFKDFCTFLLLDASKMAKATENVDDFAKAVFYVGVKQLSTGKDMTERSMDTKSKIIGETVELFKVSGNISRDEAFTRQAFLIEAIGPSNKCLSTTLKWKKGTKMSPEECKEIGTALLEEARRAYKNADPKLFDDQYVWENLDEEDPFKKYYTYFLLDPRKLTKVLESVDDFADAVFYVGKGSGNRVYNHRDETNKIVKDPKSWENRITTKHQQIIEIWRDVRHILQLKVSRCISWGEAATREAFLIETIGLDDLANNKMGTYNYYPKASKKQKKSRMPKTARREVGTALLQEAMTIFAEKRRRCAPMSMYYSPKSNPLPLVKLLVHDKSCKKKFEEFENIVNEELKRFGNYPKNTEKCFFSFVYVMLDLLKLKSPTTCSLAGFVDALIYISLEKECHRISEQRHREAREMHERGLASNDQQFNRMHKFWKNEESREESNLHFCHFKIGPTSFARGLYFEGLIAYILGKEKTNDLVIDVREMMSEENLVKASIGLLERFRICYVKTGTNNKRETAMPTPPETSAVRSTPPQRHLFELSAPLAVAPPVEPLPTAHLIPPTPPSRHPAHLFLLPALLAAPPVDPLPTHLPILSDDDEGI